MRGQHGLGPTFSQYRRFLESQKVQTAVLVGLPSTVRLEIINGEHVVSHLWASASLHADDANSLCSSPCGKITMGRSRSEWGTRVESREATRVKRERERSRVGRARRRRIEQKRLAQAQSQQTSCVEGLEIRESGSMSFGSAVARDAAKLAFTVNDLTCGRGLDYQRAVLKRLLEHPLLQPVFPESVVKRGELGQCQVVCNGIASAWLELKYGVGRDRYVARNVIEAAVISVDDSKSVQAASKCIGMNRRTLRRAVKRRRMLNDREEGVLWAKSDRKKRKDALSQETIEAVETWWTEETRVSPSKKDIRRKRIGVRQFISHAGHWLEESQVCMRQCNSFPEFFFVLSISFCP